MRKQYHIKPQTFLELLGGGGKILGVRSISGSLGSVMFLRGRWMRMGRKVIILGKKPFTLKS
jgi:hypothetical protein